MNLKNSTPKPFDSLRAWLSARLAISVPGDKAKAPQRRVKLAVACATVFLIAVGVRLLHWQDSHLSSGLESLTHRYLKHADQMLKGDGILFPRDSDEPTNVQLLVHPPGYSMFAAAVFRIFGKSNDALTIAQIAADGASAVMATIIAAELFPLAAGVLAGLLIALSPHLAYYSLFRLPDSLSALPILIAVFLVVRAVRRPRLITILAAGFFIGLSCWLRSNALLLVLFVVFAVPLLCERGKRLRYSLALVAAAIITISPITIRNWVVFNHFIPLSLGAGITMIEGIGDYDKQNRFGMPSSDRETKFKDVEWHNRPDYGGGLWKPDGIQRDRYRFRRGVEVIRSNPVWFAGVMIRRAGFMLRYNDSVSVGWPFDTARVPVVAREPSFGHKLEVPGESQPVWTNTPDELKVSGNRLASEAEVRLSADGQTLEVAGDVSRFDDQFASGLIEVEKNADYVLTLPARLIQGLAAVKITSSDRRVAVASALIESNESSKSKPDAEDGFEDDSNADDFSEPNETAEHLPVIKLPFATGDRTHVLLVVSNNGSQDRAVVEIGKPLLHGVGPTPQMWTRVIRPSVRGIQRNLYTTSRLLPLVLIGIGLLAASRRKEAFILLLVVPIYYLCVQSAFHTEYRYILAMHYFLFIAASVTLYCAGKLIGQVANRGVGGIKRRWTGSQL